MSHALLETNITNLSQYTEYEIQMLGYNSKGQGTATPIMNIRTKGNFEVEWKKKKNITQYSTSTFCFQRRFIILFPSTDLDECKTGSHNCSFYSVCTNTLGAFSCSCRTGFKGDGVDCSGTKYSCRVNADLTALWTILNYDQTASRTCDDSRSLCSGASFPPGQTGPE